MAKKITTLPVLPKRQPPSDTYPAFTGDEYGKLAALSTRLENVCVLLDSVYAGGAISARGIHGVLKPIDQDLWALLQEVRGRIGNPVAGHP